MIITLNVWCEHHLVFQSKNSEMAMVYVVSSLIWVCCVCLFRQDLLIFQVIWMQQLQYQILTIMHAHYQQADEWHVGEIILMDRRIYHLVFVMLSRYGHRMFIRIKRVLCAITIQLFVGAKELYSRFQRMKSMGIKFLSSIKKFVISPAQRNSNV